MSSRSWLGAWPTVTIRKGDIPGHSHPRNFETIRPDNILYILRQPEVANAQSVQFFFVRRNTIFPGVMNLAEAPATRRRLGKGCREDRGTDTWPIRSVIGLASVITPP